MKKRNITVIRNCQLYLNKNDIIEEWLEPGSEKNIGMKIISDIESPLTFGYCKNVNSSLLIDALRAEIIEDIFSACFWGVPVDRICQRLNAMSCVTPNGYDEWTPELIEMIIHNEIYAGYKFIEEDGKFILYLPREYKFVLSDNIDGKITELNGKSEIVIKKLSAVLIEKVN